MRISEFRITRFQFARDRVIGDSQVRADDVNIAALELIADTGAYGYVMGSQYNLRAPAQELVLD